MITLRSLAKLWRLSAGWTPPPGITRRTVLHDDGGIEIVLDIDRGMFLEVVRVSKDRVLCWRVWDELNRSAAMVQDRADKFAEAGQRFEDNVAWSATVAEMTRKRRAPR